MEVQFCKIPNINISFANSTLLYELEYRTNTTETTTLDHPNFPITTLCFQHHQYFILKTYPVEWHVLLTFAKLNVIMIILRIYKLQKSCFKSIDFEMFGLSILFSDACFEIFVIKTLKIERSKISVCKRKPVEMMMIRYDILFFSVRWKKYRLQLHK